jgi:cytochrome b561
MVRPGKMLQRELLMPDIEAGSSYTPVAKGFHWFMAAIWIAAWIIGFTAVHGGESLNPDHVTTILHKSIASTVVFLTALRLAWRFWNPVPPLPATVPARGIWTGR